MKGNLSVTPKQAEIMQLSTHLTTAQIGVLLGISKWVVQHQLAAGRRRARKNKR